MQIGANTESVIRQVGKRKKKREREKFQKIRVSSIVKKIRYFSSKSKPRILTSLSRIVIDDGRIKHRSRDAPAIFKKKRLKKKKNDGKESRQNRRGSVYIHRIRWQPRERSELTRCSKNPRESGSGNWRGSSWVAGVNRTARLAPPGNFHVRPANFQEASRDRLETRSAGASSSSFSFSFLACCSFCSLYAPTGPVPCSLPSIPGPEATLQQPPSFSLPASSSCSLFLSSSLRPSFPLSFSPFLFLQIYIEKKNNNNNPPLIIVRLKLYRYAVSFDKIITVCLRFSPGVSRVSFDSLSSSCLHPSNARSNRHFSSSLPFIFTVTVGASRTFSKPFSNRSPIYRPCVVNPTVRSFNDRRVVPIFKTFSYPTRHYDINTWRNTRS